MRVIPLRSMSGMAPASSPRSVARIVRVRERGLGDGVRARGAGEVVEAQAQHDRPADTPRRAQAAAQPVHQPDECRVQRVVRPGPAPERALRPHRAPAPARSTGRGSRLCASAWSLRPDARPSMSTSAASGSRATSATSVMPRSRSFCAVTAPTPQSRSTGSECRKSSSPPGGTSSSPSGLATALATFARNLVFAMPTVIGSPTSLRTSRLQLARDLQRRALEPLHPTRVQERLVDRDPLHVGRRLLEHLEHRLARLRVGLHARRHHHGVGTEPLRERRRPSPSAPRAPWPRSCTRAPPPPPRSPACRAAGGRRAALPTRRTRRGPRGGWWPRPTRTHVRIPGGRKAATRLSPHPIYTPQGGLFQAPGCAP